MLPISYSQPFSLDFFVSSQSILDSEFVVRIKETAISIFSTFMRFFKLVNNESGELNLKAVAMLGCISLIALLVIAIIKRRDAGLVPPNTPRH